MCQLEHAINSLLAVVNQNNAIDHITEEDMTYNWKDSDGRINDEEETNNLFLHYRNQINERINNLDLLEGTENEPGPVYKVLDWGLRPRNVRNFRSLNDRYSRLLQRINQERQNQNMDQMDNNLIEQALALTDNRTTPLSSWTKVLAAYNPNFYIYDARVALALVFLFNTGNARLENGQMYNWFIPITPGSRNITRLAREINNGRINRAGANPIDSYRTYLRLLLHQNPQSVFHTASHLEKRLFMLGGRLRDRYRKGKQNTRRAIVALARMN